MENSKTEQKPSENMSDEEASSYSSHTGASQHSSTNSDQVAMTATPTPTTLSRNQQKKLRRLERSIAMRAEKRKQEREKRKLNRKNNKAVTAGENGEKIQIQRKSLKSNLMSLSSNKLRVVIDCSFEQLMNSSDIRHLSKQLMYCYATNRRMKQCLQLYLTSCAGETKAILDRSGLPNWDVHNHAESYVEVFAAEPLENLCYLTSDSPNELEEFDESKVYIIGGFVDHNHYKSHCFNLAVEKKIMHYRLPINKFMHMKTRPVLTVNQVYEIVCRYLECKDWKQAFVSTLPKRKGAEMKEDDGDDDLEKCEFGSKRHKSSDDTNETKTESN